MCSRTCLINEGLHLLAAAGEVNPPTPQGYERVVSSAFHSMLLVEFSLQSCEVKMEYIRSLEAWEMSYFEGGDGA